MQLLGEVFNIMIKIGKQMALSIVIGSFLTNAALADPCVTRYSTDMTKIEYINSLPYQEASEISYLDKMIRLHEKSIKASQKQLKYAEHPTLKEFLKSDIISQTKELEQLENWRYQWYGL